MAAKKNKKTSYKFLPFLVIAIGVISISALSLSIKNRQTVNSEAKGKGKCGSSYKPKINPNVKYETREYLSAPLPAKGN